MPTDRQNRLKKYCLDGDVEKAKRFVLRHPEELTDKAFINALMSEINYLRDEAPFVSLAVQYDEVLLFLKGKCPLRHSDDPSSRAKLYGYLPHRDDAKMEEDLHQREVTERFFRTKKPLRQEHRARALYEQINKMLTERRLTPIPVDGLSTRAVNLALVKIISEKRLFPTLKFQIGDTIILCETAASNARKRQKANLWLSVEQLPEEHFPYGTYSKSIHDYLTGVVGKDEKRTEKLLELMERKTQRLASFRIEEFERHGLIKLKDEDVFDEERFRHAHVAAERKAKIQKQIHYLNGLNFLMMVVEVCRRLYRREDGSFHYPDACARESDAMPIAILQVRTSRLLQSGIIALRDAVGSSTSYSNSDQFKYRAAFGVASGKGTIDEVDEMKHKADRINAATERCLIKPAVDSGAYVSTLFAPDQFHAIKAGRNFLRQELGSMYGGDSESEGSDYSEDEDVGALAEGIAVFGLR